MFDYLPRQKVFKEWFVHLWNTSYNHGSLLAEMLGTPRGKEAGYGDSGWLADRYLEEAIARKLVLRQEYKPSREQQFFGVGGMEGGNKNMKVYDVCYWYKPNYASEAAKRYLEEE